MFQSVRRRRSVRVTHVSISAGWEWKRNTAVSIGDVRVWCVVWRTADTATCGIISLYHHISPHQACTRNIPQESSKFLYMRLTQRSELQFLLIYSYVSDHRHTRAPIRLVPFTGYSCNKNQHTSHPREEDAQTAVMSSFSLNSSSRFARAVVQLGAARDDVFCVQECDRVAKRVVTPR